MATYRTAGAALTHARNPQTAGAALFVKRYVAIGRFQPEKIAKSTYMNIKLFVI
jgi:hypothetical protein